MMAGARPLRIAYYGDDFTGATDTLATATQGGLRTLLFLRVPTAEMLVAAGELDCIGIAGASRSMTPADMEAELAPVAACFAALDAPVVHYKTCSTFDSSPTIGNIAVALRILADAVPSRFIPIVGGQPNIGRYCAFANLFAAATAGGPVFRIDRHPTMSCHPVTPMGEADLRPHFAAQGLMNIRSVPYPAYDIAADFDRMIDSEIEGGGSLLFDVTRPSDLAPIGRAIWREAQRGKLVAAGPSGVTQALCAHWHCTGEVAAPSGSARVAAADGPVFVMAGSLSPVTRQQIEAATDFVRIAVEPELLLRGDPDYIATLVRQVSDQLSAGHSVIAHTTPLGDAVAADRAGVALAQATGGFIARLLSTVRVRRIGVAGGDTSSWILRALDVSSLSFVGHLTPGVALCRAHGLDLNLDGIEIMLKGGQMGPADVFDLLRRGHR